MPQVLALVIAGAGLYAGFKWVQRTLKDAEQAARQREAALREARASAGAKNLGALEWDAKAGVYRPRKEA